MGRGWVQQLIQFCVRFVIIVLIIFAHQLEMFACRTLSAHTQIVFVRDQIFSYVSCRRVLALSQATPKCSNATSTHRVSFRRFRSFSDRAQVGRRALFRFASPLTSTCTWLAHVFFLLTFLASTSTTLSMGASILEYDVCVRARLYRGKRDFMCSELSSACRKIVWNSGSTQFSIEGSARTVLGAKVMYDMYCV